jgi:RNA polymerase sigma factor (sigma-70 family)
MSIAAPIEPASAAAADATRLLFERHSTRIHAFCLRRLGSREEADDAVQQTFLKAFAAVRRGVVPVVEKAWLYRIAENVCTDRLRSATYRRRHETAPDALAAVAAPPRVTEAEGIGDALAGLTEQQRRALVLREWQGLSYREIGRELSLSQSAVETLLFRARRSLARRLEAFSLAGWVKSTLAGGGATKAAAAAVATIGVGAVALPPAVDRLSTEPRRTTPRENVTAPRPVEDARRAPAGPGLRDSESQAPPTGSRRRLPAENPSSDAESSLPSADAGPRVGVSDSETQASDRPSAAPEASSHDGLTAPNPSVPVPPDVPVSVPEVTVPAPLEVVEPVTEVLEPVADALEPVTEVLEPVVEAIPALPETKLPALPTLP